MSSTGKGPYGWMVEADGALGQEERASPVQVQEGDPCELLDGRGADDDVLELGRCWAKPVALRTCPGSNNGSEG